MDNAEKKWSEFFEKCAGFCSKLLGRIPKALEKAIQRSISMDRSNADRDTARIDANHAKDMALSEAETDRIKKQREIDEIKHQIEVKKLQRELKEYRD